MDGPLPGSIETVVIGAGHAGLLMSWHLQQAGRDHVVLDRREVLGGSWQDRWDGFQLVGPNWTTDLPGYPYDDGDPDGFMTRDEVAGRMRRYADVIAAPVHRGVEVQRLTKDGAGERRFRLETSDGRILADDVIVATGAFHTPKIPAAASVFSTRPLQLHAHHYRNPGSLPPGGVLVVGSGQTGVQLAEELRDAGREVVLSVGHCGRAPRRYRGHDFFWWFRQLATRGPGVGVPLPSVGQLPDPRMKFACNPALSGHGGGHETNLRRMANDGIRLAGRFAGADGERVTFAEDLGDNLRFADGFFDERFRPMFESFANAADIEMSEDDRAPFDYDPSEVPELSLADEGIGTVLWTTGYSPDYRWLDVPILDEAGLPRHVRGVTEVPGLTFIGLLWQLNNTSANLLGVFTDAEYLVSRW